MKGHRDYYEAGGRKTGARRERAWEGRFKHSFSSSLAAPTWFLVLCHIANLFLSSSYSIAWKILLPTLSSSTRVALLFSFSHPLFLWVPTCCQPPPNLPHPRSVPKIISHLNIKTPGGVYAGRVCKSFKHSLFSLLV